jgi:hypothetical protein
MQVLALVPKGRWSALRELLLQASRGRVAPGTSLTESVNEFLASLRRADGSRSSCSIRASWKGRAVDGIVQVVASSARFRRPAFP